MYLYNKLLINLIKYYNNESNNKELNNKELNNKELNKTNQITINHIFYL